MMEAYALLKRSVRMSTAQRGNTREIWRRVLSVVLVLAAVVTAFVVTHEPLARVEVMDFAQEQQDIGSFYGLWTDEQKALKAMPLADYIASVTAGKTTAVDSTAWNNFAEGRHGRWRETFSRRLAKPRRRMGWRVRPTA